MNLRTKSIYPYAGLYHSVDIFGYSTHGIPGIEIVGLGKFSRSIKEKFIYLSRVRQLKIPKKRFVICVDIELDGKKIKEEDLRYLELPMLIMFWSLSGNLPFSKLDDCFTAGKISIDNEIKYISFPMEFQKNLLDLLNLEESQELKVIAPEGVEVIEDYYHLSLEEVLKSINNFH